MKKEEKEGIDRTEWKGEHSKALKKFKTAKTTSYIQRTLSI